MNKQHDGFTLIEILVALAIFALLAVITASSMYYAFNNRTRVNEQAEQLANLQLTITLLKQDIGQFSMRPVRGDDYRFFPEFIGQSNYVEFTRAGLPNPQSKERRSTLHRIAYLCTKQQLIRRSWPVLDSPHRKKFQDKVMLDNLSTCRLAYLNSRLQVLDEWRANTLPGRRTVEKIPMAVKISLDVPQWGKGSLLFIIPEGLYGS